ncbi:DnaJ-like chaperonin [Microbacterium phage Blab]|nr:DnaJ-like chaperonin [Microbacterium phage Blab]
MSEWPGRLTVGPIREWPGAHTRSRRSAPFRYGGKPVKLTTTLSELDTELRAVAAKDAELLVAIDPAKFRRDGRPYANAIAEHPGVILSFEIPKLGRVSYPCDTFTTWEDNLRAVVLSLEALRKVDRYGTTQHREQYRGFLAIEATAAPAGFSSAEDALMFLAGVTGLPYADYEVAYLLRRAKMVTHPDRPGGDAASFQRVMLAEAKLGSEGRR